MACPRYRHAGQYLRQLSSPRLGREMADCRDQSDATVRYPRLNDVGLSLARPPHGVGGSGGRLRDHGRSDSGPGDGARRIAISMRRIPARDTTKHGLSGAVAAFRMPTGAASLTGVRRIDACNRNARQPRLGADELPHLCNGPIAVSRSFRFPYRCPRADARQVFKRNRPLPPPHGVFRGGQNV